MEPFCERMINKESLLKLVSNANRILADQGHACIISLIESVRPAKTIQRIVEEFQSKNPLLRYKISQYITKMLEVFPAAVIEKHSSQFENVIFHGVSDAGEQTRSQARAAYKLFAELCPNQAEKLFSKFDHAIQKKLSDPKTQHLEISRNGENDDGEEKEEEDDTVDEKETEKTEIESPLKRINSRKGALTPKSSLFDGDSKISLNDQQEETNGELNKSKRNSKSARKHSRKKTDKEASDNEESIKSKSTAASKKNRSGSSLNLIGLNSDIVCKSEHVSPKKSVKLENGKLKDLLSSYYEGPHKEEESPTKILWSQRSSPKSLLDGALAAIKKKDLSISQDSSVPSPLFLKVKAAMESRESKSMTRPSTTPKAKLVSMIAPMSDKKSPNRSLATWKSSGNINGNSKSQILQPTKRKNIKLLTTPGFAVTTQKKSASPLLKEVNNLLIFANKLNVICLCLES